MSKTLPGEVTGDVATGDIRSCEKEMGVATGLVLGLTGCIVTWGKL